MDIFSKANQSCVSPDRIAELINPVRLSATLGYYSLQNRLNDAGGVNVPAKDKKMSITISDNGTGQLPTVEHLISLRQLKAHASNIDGQIVLTSQKCWDPVATLLSSTESALEYVEPEADVLLQADVLMPVKGSIDELNIVALLDRCLKRIHIPLERELSFASSPIAFVYARSPNGR